jgi:iron(III) transport system permease protein
MEAYRDMSGNTYWGGATTLSVIMVLTVVAVMVLQRRYLERHKFETIGGRSVGAPRLYRNVWGCRLLFLLTLLLLGFPLVNVIVLIMLSLSASWGSDQLLPSLTIANYKTVLGTSLHFITNGLCLSLLAVLFCLILGTCVAWMLYRTTWWGKHLLDTLVLIPFILPGTAFAIALVTAFNQPPLALHLTAQLVVIAYIVTRTPYAVRSVTASLSQIGPSMEEASSTLGGTGSLTALKVLLPMVRPGLLAGGIMAFISCMTDVAITLMVCPPRWYPVSVSIYLQTAESKYFLAAAYGIVLMVFIFGAYTAMLRLGKTRELAS